MRVYTAAAGFAVTPEEFMATGDTVAVVVSDTGTGKATGKPLDLPVVHVWEIQDGKPCASVNSPTR
jgi:ketosteroid isomerase-like protein